MQGASGRSGGQLRMRQQRHYGDDPHRGRCHAQIARSDAPDHELFCTTWDMLIPAPKGLRYAASVEARSQFVAQCRRQAHVHAASRGECEVTTCKRLDLVGVVDGVHKPIIVAGPRRGEPRHTHLLLYLTRGRESAGLPTRTPGRKRSLLLLAAGPTQKDPRACLPLAYGRWPNTCAQDLRPCADRASAHGEGNRAREVRSLPATATRTRSVQPIPSVQPLPEEVSALLPPEIRCVVGSDVAKSAPVVCALEAPRGAPRLKSTPLPATAAGYAQLLAWLGAWEAGEPATLLLGLESTGSRWEPLYDALTQAGYTLLLLNPHQTASWATSLGLRPKTPGSDAHTLARGLLAGWARTSSVPDETVQALRALTRARRDLVENQRAARQRLHDELVPVFPELVGHLPEHADLGRPGGLAPAQRLELGAGAGPRPPGRPLPRARGGQRRPLATR